MRGVHDARGWLGDQQRLELAGPPTRFFLDLAGCGFGWGLPGVDHAHGYLPAPPPGDEPVSPNEQRPLLIINQGRPSRWCHADEPMIQVPAIRQLYVRGAQV